MVWFTSTITEDGGSGYSCFMIFASLLMIHCLKPAHSSLPMLAFIWVQFCSRNRTGRSLNLVFFLCFRLFIPRYSALSSFFIHLNPVQKLMISNLMIMFNLMDLCRRSVVSLLVLQSTTQFTPLVIHTSVSERKIGYRNPAWELSACHEPILLTTSVHLGYFIVYSVCNHSPGV